MTFKRKVIKTETPPAHQGFLGPGHTARAVVYNNFEETDPFILLMDDLLDKKDEEPVGGPHPHAGFETVTLMLEGEMGDEDHKMQAGDFQVMTAGRGVVHTETIEKKTRMHLLQLWLTLPVEHRWAPPRLQDLPLASVPKVSGEGLNIKVYSGTFAGVTSPVYNYVPFIVADVKMQPGVTTVQNIPASFNAFLYVVEGSVKAGEEQSLIQKNQVAWFSRFAGPSAASEIRFTAGSEATHFVLYAGEPTGDKIVSHGPFIGNTQEDIIRLYKQYREGRMPHISTVAEAHGLKS